VRRADQLHPFLFAALSVLAVAAALSCRSSGRSAEQAPIVIRLPDGPPPDTDHIRFDPPGHVKSLRLDEVRNLSLDTDGASLTAYLPESCPVAIPPEPLAGRVRALPMLRLEGDVSQVGYDAAFELTAALGCPDAERGRVEWRQLEGPPLVDLTVQEGGRRFRARTLPRSRFFPDPLPTGIVAVSPRTQGRYVVEATLSLGDLPAVRRTVTVTSIARSTGLSSLAVSQRVMLGGSGWHVEHAPSGSRARVEDAGGTSIFAPDVAGRWMLADTAGNRMGVQALTHDRTPLDCGRAECHAAIAAAAFSTPMSEALMRSLGSSSTPSCALECHVVGERGLHDGGFFDVKETLGFQSPGVASFEGMPHALQRLGGVRCTSCHGPGAIPEPGDRARVLRVSVCASCHDSPPAYTHVESWSRSAMARADRAVETRSAACARCHTTGGFLDAIGVRRRPDASRDPDGATVGIACAACHAVHGAHVGALVRTVARPPSLGSDVEGRPEVASSVCVTCHAPARDETLPSAASAALVEGRFRFPVALGDTEEKGPAPHANVASGCIGCHGASPGKSRGTDHRFAIDAATCTTCHAGGVPKDALDASGRTLHDRAAALMSKLRRKCAATEVVETPHSRPSDLASCKLPPEQARALYIAALVSDDRAAAVHNAPFARSLLDRAEAALEARDSSRASPTSRPSPR